MGNLPMVAVLRDIEWDPIQKTRSKAIPRFLGRMTTFGGSLCWVGSAHR
jgi:hypothetical protein